VDRVFKILSIVPAPLLPAVSGGQKHTYGLLLALGKLCDLNCITDTQSEKDGHGFELKPLIYHNYKKYFSFSNFKIFKKEIKAFEPQAILLEQPYMGILLHVLSRKRKIPMFIHAHNVEYLRFQSLGKWWWPLLYAWERFVFRKCKAIFFISEEDRQLAIKHLKIPPSKCYVSPYGVPHQQALVLPGEKREKVRERHGISPDETVFMFFGVLKYLPNIEALEIIIKHIAPRLKEHYKHPYKIMICGGGLNNDFKEQLSKLDDDNIIYTGFVENIDEYTQSADVILNPILNGGGVKTKVVEALSFNKPVVSTNTGALGINSQVCGNMLYVLADNDWKAFVDAMTEAAIANHQIRPDFFSTYSWNAIAEKLLADITENI
jgi:polysaccharide biosynthesis protein PslH